jgi:hypothetical protein
LTANNSIADLKSKLATLEKDLEVGREKERELLVSWEKEKAAHADAATTFDEHKKALDLWTGHLVDVTERVTAQVTMMDKENHSFTIGEHDSTSASLTLFFEGLLEVLKKHHEKRSANFASESRKFCSDVVSKMLIKIICRNPGIDVSKAFKSLPPGTDTTAAEEAIAPLISKIHQVPRTEGDRKD